jgi:DNA-binding winged helix-turn-helix (wHTH) protein
LGDSAENPQFIETLPRHGYRFIAPTGRLRRRRLAAAIMGPYSRRPTNSVFGRAPAVQPHRRPAAGLLR